MWFIGVGVEQETTAPPPKKNPGSAPECTYLSAGSRVTLSLNQHYFAFLGVLHFQLMEIPKDFFVDIVSTNNFLTTTLQVDKSDFFLKW